MAVRVANVEQQYARKRKELNEEIERVWKKHRDPQHGHLMPKPLIDIIEQRLVMITDRWRIIYDYRMKCPLVTSKKLVGFGPCLSIQTKHALTKKQLALLNRGPAYVIPCQLLRAAIASPASMTETMKDLYGPLKQQLARIFAKHQVNIALSMDFHIKLQEKFNQQFSNPIPTDLSERTSMETMVMQSIRRQLQQPKANLILRRMADDRNVFYLGNRQEFDEKAKVFMAKTDIYDFQVFIDEKRYGMEWQNEVHDMLESMNYILRRIHEKKGIESDLLQRLTVDASTIKMAYLYFLPQISEENEQLSLVPIISAYGSPTWLLGRFLDRILRPFVRRVLEATTFDDETHFAWKLRQFCQSNGRALSPTTLLGTIRVTNYHAMAPHTVMADVLEHFLRDQLPEKRLEKITVDHLKNLVQLFLYNNVFVYEERIYTCVKGSPTTIPLSETLANIYLFQWQKPLLKLIKDRRQFFGRHQHEMFVTWDGSKDELQSLLEQLQAVDQNVHLKFTVDLTIEYLNARLENRAGQLVSCVDHRSQRYTLPFFMHHSIEDHSDWLRFALLRAVCYSSSVLDFARARIHLELTYLTNGYSLYYVERRVDHFFGYFDTTMMRYTTDQTCYDRFRARVFTFVEKQHHLVEKLH